MKTKIGLIISLVLVSPLFAHAELSKDLYFGITNEPQVSELQKFLTEQKVYTGPITGNFFSLTQQAVKAFQIKQGIFPTSGYFGPKTRKIVSSLYSTIAMEEKTTSSDPIKSSNPLTENKPQIFIPTPPSTTLCNGKYWTQCPTGQSFYCPATGDAQCIQKITQTKNVNPPTLEQLANLRRFCLASTYLNSVCSKPEFMPGYNSNLIFRSEIDKFVAQYFAIISDQQKQQIAEEKKKFDCLMQPTPEDQRVLDPATQNYLRQSRCGTITEQDKATYELSRLKSSVDELKYRLESKISFPPLFLDSAQLPSNSYLNNSAKWQVRWEGSSGTVTDSLGNHYQFHCEDSFCRSY